MENGKVKIVATFIRADKNGQYFRESLLRQREDGIDRWGILRYNYVNGKEKILREMTKEEALIWIKAKREEKSEKWGYFFLDKEFVTTRKRLTALAIDK